MKTVILAALPCFLLSACGGNPKGKSEDAPRSSGMTRELGQASVGDCASGGVVLGQGVDRNNNGELDDNEINVTVIVCNGEDGDSCTVADNGDGTKTITCEDGTSATVSDGADGSNGTNGADGDSCTVVDNGNGTSTISCTDGTSVVVSDGADGTDGTSCTVSDNGDGTKTISCEDGTSAVVSDGADGAAGSNGADGSSCSVTDNGDGTKTIACEDGTSVTVSDGAPVDPSSTLYGSFVVTNSYDAAVLNGYTAVTGDVTITAPGVVSLDLPNVVSVGGDLLLEGNDVLTSVDFSSLESVGDFLAVQNNDDALNLSFPALTSVSSVTVSGNTGLQSFAATSLETASTVIFDFNDGLTSLDFSALTSLTGGGMYIGRAPALTSLTGFDLLASITGDFLISQNDILASASFPVLATVTGSASIDQNPAFPECDAEALMGQFTAATENLDGNQSACEGNACGGGETCVTECAEPVAYVCNSAVCSSFALDGATSYAEIADTDALDLLTNEATIEAWIYEQGSTTSLQGIVSKGLGTSYKYHLWGNTFGEFEFSLFDGSNNPEVRGGTRVQGAWTHIAATWDGTTMKLWQDGVDVSSAYDGAAASTISFTNEATPVVIGKRDPTGTENVFDGVIDEVRISNMVQYTSAFTPAAQLEAVGGTVGLWRFDEGSGATSTDDSGNGNTATLTNGEWVNTCNTVSCSSAVEFNDTAGLATITDSPDLDPGTEPMTIEFWARLDKGDLHPVLSKHDGTGGGPGTGYWIAVSSNNLVFRMGDDSSGQSVVSSLANVADGVEHHFAIVRDTDAGELRMYVDGGLRDTATDNEGNVDPGPTDLYFGHDATVPTRTADGTLDEVRIWKNARYDADFIPVRCEQPGTETGLVGEWTLEEGSGSSIADSSGSGGNDGTLSGGYSWASAP